MRARGGAREEGAGDDGRRAGRALGNEETPNAERRTPNAEWERRPLHSALGVGRWAFGVLCPSCGLPLRPARGFDTTKYRAARAPRFSWRALLRRTGSLRSACCSGAIRCCFGMTITSCRSCRFCGCGAELVGRRAAVAESVLLGLQQSGGGISVRDVLGFRECGGGPIWKLPLTFPQQAAALSLAHLFVLGMGGYLLARGRELVAPLALMVGLVAALEWLDRLLGRDGLVRRAGRVCLAAVGLVGNGARARWRGAGRIDFFGRRRSSICSSRADFLTPWSCWWCWLAGWRSSRLRKRVRSNPSGPLVVGLLLGVGLSAPAWLALFDYVSGSARQAQDPAAHFQWIVPLAALPGFILPAWTVAWADFSTRLMPHGATELACGFVPPVALLFALVTRGRLVVRQLRWELGLLALVLLLSMLPTANMFRWSFRWLPLLALVHRALRGGSVATAGAVAECGRVRDRPGAGAGWRDVAGAYRRGKWLAAFRRHAGSGGDLGAGACAPRFRVAQECGRCRSSPASHFSPLIFLLPTNGGVPKYNLDQRLTEAAPLDPDRLYLSVYPAPEHRYRREVQPAPFGRVVRPGSTSMWGGVRLINGYSPIRPAGVAREFEFAIHGEIAPWAGEYFPQGKAGRTTCSRSSGVDGIIVARESEITPQPAAEWELVHSSEEGRVYHRRGGPLPAGAERVRQRVRARGNCQDRRLASWRVRCHLRAGGRTAGAAHIFAALFSRLSGGIGRTRIAGRVVARAHARGGSAGGKRGSAHATLSAVVADDGRLRRGRLRGGNAGRAHPRGAQTGLDSVCNRSEDLGVTPFKE